MSEKNLMDFESPLKCETPPDIESDVTGTPGSNPFDTLLESAESCGNINNWKVPFPLLEHSDDDGRESLGILQIDLENVQFADTNWLNVPDITVNENVSSTPEKSTDQLNTAFLYSDISSGNGKMSVSSSVSSSNSYSTVFEKHFNTAFLYSNRNAFSESSSTTSATHNTLDLNELSKVHPINNTYKCCDSNDKIESIVNEKRDFMINDLKQSRHSCSSILHSAINRSFRKSESLFRRSFTPSQLLKENDIENDNFNDSVFIEAKHVASKLANESIYDTDVGELYSLDCTPQPEWLDVCDQFDENSATSTADIFKNVDKMIPSNELDRNSPIIREEVIGHVGEKICEVAPGEKLDNSKKSNSSKPLDNTSSSSVSSRNECFTNLSEIFSGDCKKFPSSRLSHCSNNSLSKDAKSILTNLSAILNNENPSAQQKYEGQSLLSSLADILCLSEVRNSQSEIEQSEDSGNSSIEQELLRKNKPEDTSCDAPDVQMNSEISVQPLDLSIARWKILADNSVINLSADNRVAVRKSLNDCPQSDKSKNESTNSNDSKNSNLKVNISEVSVRKLKPKKIDRKIIPDKGPLKAMIPVGSMSKPKGITRNPRIDDTPPRRNHANSVYKIRSTSSSKSESKLRPIAQSTPEVNCGNKKYVRTTATTTTQLPQRRFGSPVSPLTRPSGVKIESTEDLSKRNHSGSAPNLSSPSVSKNNSSIKSTQPLYRRRSASEIKLSKDTFKFKRSNTIDKASEISSALSRVRNNIEKARHSSVGVKPVGITKPVNRGKFILGARNHVSSSSNIKPCNLVNKMGKENKLK